MRLPLLLILAFGAVACVGRVVPLNSDFSPPTSPEILRSLELRERYDVPKPIGAEAIYVDSVIAHHFYSEASTIVWKDESGQWQWSQVAEVGPGGMLPAERKLEWNRSSALTVSQSEALDRLLADPQLYLEDKQTAGAAGVGTPLHVMSIVTSFGRRTISWGGKLEGLNGKVADIVLAKP